MEETWKPTGAFTGKKTEPTSTPLEETPNHYITRELSADTGKILNVDGPVFGTFTEAGWGAVARVSGMAVKVALWGCMNAKRMHGGEVEFRLHKAQQAEVMRAVDCHEQSIINAVAELLKAGIIRRLSPGVLRFNTRYVQMRG